MQKKRGKKEKKKGERKEKKKTKCCFQSTWLLMLDLPFFFFLRSVLKHFSAVVVSALEVGGRHSSKTSGQTCVTSKWGVSAPRLGSTGTPPGPCASNMPAWICPRNRLESTLTAGSGALTGRAVSRPTSLLSLWPTRQLIWPIPAMYLKSRPVRSLYSVRRQSAWNDGVALTRPLVPAPQN